MRSQSMKRYKELLTSCSKGLIKRYNSCDYGFRCVVYSSCDVGRSGVDKRMFKVDKVSS